MRLGAIIFNSPALLGGQAEKQGLSCGSCHQNGRGNPEFQLDAVSGAPGTADVTSGLFSKVRADNTFNPVSIPDIARSEGRKKVDRRDRAALGTFVRGQIVEEFSGDEPSGRALDLLLTYLEHLDDREASCASDETKARHWEQDWHAAKLAAEQAGDARLPEARAFWVRTARLSIGRIHDRYGASEHAGIRADLVALSRALGTGAAWPDDTERLMQGLQNGAAQSLYDPDALRAALKTP